MSSFRFTLLLLVVIVTMCSMSEARGKRCKNSSQNTKCLNRQRRSWVTFKKQLQRHPNRICRPFCKLNVKTKQPIKCDFFKSIGNTKRAQKCVVCQHHRKCGPQTATRNQGHNYFGLL